MEGMSAKIIVDDWFSGGDDVFYLNAVHKGIYGRWLGEIWREVGEISLNDFLKNNYLRSDYWTTVTQEQLIESWSDEKDWKRWAQYSFAKYGVRCYSVSTFGRYGLGEYEKSKYKNIFNVARYGYYGSDIYNQVRFN